MTAIRRRASHRWPLIAGGVLMSLWLGACSTPTPYQQALQGYGFAETRTGPKNYRVAFTGNWMTERQAIHRYVLYRAAELAEQQGYDHLGVEDASQIVKHYGELRPRPTTRLDFELEQADGDASSGGRRGGGGVREKIEFYQAVLDVAFYRGTDRIPPVYREVYATKDVLNRLNGTIDRGAAATAAAAAPVAEPAPGAGPPPNPVPVN